MHQCCTPSANMIQSHPTHYLSVRVIAYVTRSIRSLWLSNMPNKVWTFRNKKFNLYYTNAHYKNLSHNKIHSETKPCKVLDFNTWDLNAYLGIGLVNWLVIILFSWYVLNNNLLCLYHVSHKANKIAVVSSHNSATGSSAFWSEVEILKETPKPYCLLSINATSNVLYLHSWQSFAVLLLTAPWYGSPTQGKHIFWCGPWLIRVTTLIGIWVFS